MWYEVLFSDYITYEKRYSPHTALAYHTDMAQFIAFASETFQVTSAEAVTHVHVRSWAVRLMQEGVSPRSVNRKLSCLKSYFRFLLKRQLLQHNPMLKVTGPRMPRRLPNHLLEEQVALWDQLPYPERYRNICERLVLEVLYQTGIRRSELISLRIEDVDLKSGQMRIFGKGKKIRLVPFGAALRQQLTSFLALREAEFPDSSENSLFLTEKGAPLYAKWVYLAVRKYTSMVTTAEKRGPHMLRHSFATHLSDHGADLHAIKSLLGHANLAATQIYTHNSVEKLRKVYDAAHPKSGNDREEGK